MPDDTFHTLLSATIGPKGRLNPHGGKELEMLLAGDKPMAMFTQGPSLGREYVGDDAFGEHVASGALLYRKLYYPDGNYTTHFYARPDEEWRIKAMDSLKRSDPATGEFATFNMHDYYRMVGFLLGYEKTDVEFFIKHRDARHAAGE